MMNLPNWLQPHLFIGKNFKDLTAGEIETIKENMKGFQSESPEVSILIPAWNEENNIYRTLSSLAKNKTSMEVEIVVINNNSTDQTQEVLDLLNVKSYFQPQQGITFARQMGLEKAKGKYHLGADSDTFYPPNWIESMVKPMKEDSTIVGVYGRYSFIPPIGEGRMALWAYEKMTGVLTRLRKKNREYINFLGFNMGFVTKVGLENGGFVVTDVRKFDNARDSEYHVEESEDGRMAVNLQKTGKLMLVTGQGARAYTSSRRLVAEGGIFKSFTQRIFRHLGAINEYIGLKK
ncbi:glycosyltransferase [Pedobacter sp. MC2016-14]|uniref:glycosyltransferase family 2 protein n=1 Tax=Pedobacter sp. MC2016-14 TaxID=2897327 RepID=UPI001E3504BB|nr:glycosyltransferase family 2 protein [Pedobacter sp. MC2016-14]MCD0490209.1 glycosyltransferase [Pedobacter sp. MC2016-14]